MLSATPVGAPDYRRAVVIRMEPNRTMPSIRFGFSGNDKIVDGFLEISGCGAAKQPTQIGFVLAEQRRGLAVA